MKRAIVLLTLVFLIGMSARGEAGDKASPQIGGPNPLASIPEKKPSRPDRLSANIRALTKDNLAKWEGAIKAATGDNLSRQSAFFFMSDFDRVFDKKGFREGESTLLLNRMKLVPAEEADAWRKALSKVIDGDVIPRLTDKQATLVVIIQQDPLFKGKKFDPVLSKVFRDRIAAMPKKVVDKAAEYELLGNDSAMDKATATTALASYDRLFAQDGFQNNIWEEIVKEYQKKRPAKK